MEINNSPVELTLLGIDKIWVRSTNGQWIEKEMAKSFELKSVPTFVLFENGKEVSRLIGAQTKQSLLEFIGNE